MKKLPPKKRTLVILMFVGLTTSIGACRDEQEADRLPPRGANAPVEEPEATVSQDVPATGNFAGVVRFQGTPPKLPPLRKKGVPANGHLEFCSLQDIPDESLIVGPNGGLANVFVYLLKAPKKATIPAVPKAPVVLDRQGCRFVPHVLIVRVGQAVLAKNDDPLRGNNHISPRRNAALNVMIEPKDRRGVPIVFQRAEDMPIEVRCDCCGWMRAWMLVLAHPFAAVTKADGSFEISGLPPGQHKFRIWHERRRRLGGYLRRSDEVTIKPGQTTKVELRFERSVFDL